MWVRYWAKAVVRSGGALISGANLDQGVMDYFSESDCEVWYEDTRIQPLIFQDDVARLATDIESARKGNQLLSTMINTKFLEMHEEKSGFLLFGDLKQTKDMETEMSKSPLTFGDFITKREIKEKYLGDQIHEEGLQKSVEATISERKGRITAAIYEVRSIVEDVRMQSIGGLQGAFDLWELAVIPSFHPYSIIQKHGWKSQTNLWRNWKKSRTCF